MILSNYQESIDNKKIIVDDIKDIVKSVHIDHQQLKVIDLSTFCRNLGFSDIDDEGLK